MTHVEKRQRRKDIAAAVRDGDESHDVCARFGVSLAAVYDACRENGVAHSNSHARRRVLRETVAKYVREGHNIAEAASHFKLGVSAVSQACLEFGVKPQGSVRRGIVDFDAYTVLAMLLNTKRRYADIGSELGLSRERVRQVAIRAIAAGIKIPKRGA